MSTGWRRHLRADPIPWLLEPEDPAVRYGTLTSLLERSAGDPEVRRAQEVIPAWLPLAELLAAQKRDGYWMQRDYYLPKHSSTFWVLSLLGDLGLAAEIEQVRRGCSFMFTLQRDDGSFCRRRRVAGKGIVWDTRPGPCTHARIVRFLIQFGYGDDPRVRAGIGWLLADQREDGMWHCRHRDRYGCLRATLDVLRVATLDPETAAHPAVARGAQAVCELLVGPRMSRYHVPDEWPVLVSPNFGYGIVPALEALARLGYTRAQPQVSAALDYLLDRQPADGAWPLDSSPRRPPFDVGQPGQPNKWLTLDALRVVRLLDTPDGNGR